MTIRMPYQSYEPIVDDTAYVAPTAVLVGRVEIGKNASIWFHSVLRADINMIKIGEASNIQDGCMLHVTNELPLIVGKRVTVGHGAILHGCHIESDCLIGMGAIVLDGVVVGSGSIIAAGCVVSPGTDIPEGSLVMGVPGKIVRQASEHDRRMIERGWQNYVGYSQIYQS